MQTKKIALAGIAGLVVAFAFLAVYPAVAAYPSTGASQTPVASQGQIQVNSQSVGSLTKISFTSGQTITFTSTAGGYFVVGNQDINGSASGTLTLKVNGVLQGGYVVSVTGGTISVGGTSFTITSGSSEIGPYGKHMVGQGTASDGTFFLFREQSIGSFGSAQYGILRFDLSNGTTQYSVRLLVTAATA
jgi:hypothetical protein